MKKSNSFNRRKFLKSTIIGSTGAIVGSKLMAAEESVTDTPDTEKKIITRKLGNTGIEIPIVSMGVMTADNPNIVKAAYKAGVRHFDTAHSYQNGNNEIMVGEALKEFPRDSYIIGTKVLPEFDRSNGWRNRTIGENCTKEAFIDKFNTSLDRLQMDYVDILYVHAIPSGEMAKTPHLLDALQTLKAEGRIKHTGISTHENLPEVINASIDTGVYDVILTAINFKMKDDQAFFKALDRANKAGIGLVAMKTMAGVFLDKERTQKINCKAALKWVLQFDNIHTSIPGMETFEHLAENMSVMENLAFTEEEKNDLNSYKELLGMFCDGCSSCIPTCKKNLPVNQLMRAYMYAYGYKNTKKSYETLAECQITDNPCSDCDNCTAKCVRGFDITEKISDISRLTKVPTDFLT